MNIRELIENAKFQVREISIPEWGPDGTFFIRPVLFRDQQKVAKIASKKDASEVQVIGLSLIHSLCDKDGNPTLSESDIAVFENQPLFVLKRIMDEINKFNGFNDADPLEQAVKN